MEVYIYRTSEVNRDSFASLLEGANGPLRHLRFTEGPILGVEHVSELVRSRCSAEGSLSTEAIFESIAEIRKRADLSEDTVIVLLSRMRHEGNWFSLGEKNSHYMHADDWKLFTATSFRLPVTFLLASNIIMRGMYDSLQDIAYRAHKEPRGCIMDLCMDKPDISLKMRTADACPECMGRIRSRIREGYLDANVVIDCFRLMDLVRRDLMYRRRWRLDPEPGRLRISGYAQQIDLPGQRVSLSPIQRALYQFFLLHPEGVRLVDLPDAHHVESLVRLYQPIATIGNLQEQAETMRGVVEDGGGKLQQHLSRIRRAFRQVLGFRDAEEYFIHGRPAEPYGIALDRQFVLWTDRTGHIVDCGNPDAM